MKLNISWEVIMKIIAIGSKSKGKPMEITGDGVRLLNDLIYASYRAQRGLHGMPEDRARRLFPEYADEFAKRYQEDK